VYKPEELDEVRGLFRKLDVLTTLQMRSVGAVSTLSVCVCALTRTGGPPLLPPLCMPMCVRVCVRVSGMGLGPYSVRLACSCDFMFWNRVLLPTYFADLYDNPTDAQNIQVRPHTPSPIPSLAGSASLRGPCACLLVLRMHVAVSGRWVADGDRLGSAVHDGRDQRHVPPAGAGGPQSDCHRARV
jgi:hypothetical protein